MVKPRIAEFLIKDIYGYASMPDDSNQRNILNRLEAYTSTGDNISVELRENNGVIPRYDDFWKIVATHIEKTAVDDRRHSSSSGDGDLVVNMALALSYADLHRTCKEIAESNENDKDSIICMFLLQFWPTAASESRILKYTGRFKVKRMIQSRVMRKYNPDFHYTNAIYSFLKKGHNYMLIWAMILGTR